MKKQNFLKISLKGTFVYVILVIVLSIIYSKLVVIIPKFVEYALDGVIYKNESVIPSYISCFFYKDSWQSKILVLTIFLILINACIFFVSYIKGKEIYIEVQGHQYLINADGNLLGQTPARISIIEKAVYYFTSS